MTVANPREVPEYELNPLDIQIRRVDGISKVWSNFNEVIMPSVDFLTQRP